MFYKKNGKTTECLQPDRPASRYSKSNRFPPAVAKSVKAFPPTSLLAPGFSAISGVYRDLAKIFRSSGQPFIFSHPPSSRTGLTPRPAPFPPPVESPQRRTPAKHRNSSPWSSRAGCAFPIRPLPAMFPVGFRFGSINFPEISPSASPGFARWPNSRC